MEDYRFFKTQGNITHFRCHNRHIKKCKSILTKDIQGEILRKTRHSDRCRHLKIKKTKFDQDTKISYLENVKIVGKYWKIPKYNKSHHNIFKDTLDQAFTKKKMKFCDDLSFKNVNIPPKYLETIQEIDKKDEEAFLKFKKEFTSKKYFGPLQIKWHCKQGFVVEASDQIEPNTLICEYTGEVIDKSDDFYSDDLMEYATFDDKNYVIAPRRKGNIARFISGINNSKKFCKQKQNLTSIKFRIKNKIRIALYTIKRVKKGQILYYDYNAGPLSKKFGIDTDDFE